MGALTPEAKVKRKVTAVLKKHGCWYFFPASNGYGRAGIPDIYRHRRWHLCWG